MNLVYIWVEEYKNLKNFNLNIDPQFLLNFDLNNKELLIDYNTNYIPNFYKLKINNQEIGIKLKAIIGENGSGKTSSLELIKYVISQKRSIVNVKLIYCILKDSKFIIFTNQKFKITNNTKLSHEKSDTLYNDFRNNSLIYFSPVFDSKDEFIEEENVNSIINISTNFLIYKDYVDYKNPNYSPNDHQSNYEFINGANPVIVHKKYEIKRQLYFAKDNKNKFADMEINFPNIGLIKIAQINIKSIYPDGENIKNTSFKSFYDFLEFYEGFFNRYIKMFKTKKDWKNLNKTLIAKSIFFNFANNAGNKKYNFDYMFKYFNSEDLIKRKDANITKVLIDIFNNLKNKTYDRNNKNSRIVLIEQNIEYLKYIDRIFRSENFNNFYENSFQIDFSKDLDILIEFINKYLSVSPSLDFIDFEIRDLSSGEKAYLNIFSRFYEIVNEKVNELYDLNENITILIDEGELYFHPQWQKKFIYLVLEMLSIVLVNARFKSINLLITSNSPFIISDIPKDNIIFLQKDVNGNIITISDLDDKKNTFANNIHTLLIDSFFIRNGMIGEFAKEKINEILGDLELVNVLSEERLDEIKKIISVIGEPIVLKKLSEMYINKVNLGLSDRVLKLENEFKNSKNK